MIDFETYKELHPKNQYSTMNSHLLDKVTTLPTDGSEPRAPEIYLFPPRIPGFDLRRKKWSEYLISR